MAVNPLDVYGIIADPNRSADDKRAAIDMLYGGVAAPPAAPDARLAEVSVPSDSVMFGSGALNVPPAPSPAMSDAGGMSMAPPPAPAPVAPPMPVSAGGMSVAPAAPPAPATSEPTMSVISPDALAAAASSKASTPAVSTSHEGEAPPAEPSAD